MRKTLTVFLISLASVLWADEAKVDIAEVRIETLVQDNNRTVWGINETERPGVVFRLATGKWEEEKLPFVKPEEAKAKELVLRSDGAVIGLWQTSERRMALTRHHTFKSEIIAQDISANERIFRKRPMLFADSHERVWIMADERQIYRLERDERLQMVYEMGDSERVNSTVPAGRMNSFAAVEDGRGRVWVWTPIMATNYDGLRGVVIFDGKEVKKQTDFAGIKEASLLAIAKLDEKRMLVSVPDGGIYSVDIDSFNATRLEGAEGAPFKLVLAIHVEGQDIYAVTWQELEDSIWRRRDGKWEKVATVSNDSGRPTFWTDVGDGAVVAQSRPGMWYLPPKGEPVGLNWQNGFPLANVSSLIVLPGGKLMMANRQAVATLNTLVLPPKPPLPTRVEELLEREAPITDASGRVWYLEREGRNRLRGWDGKAWQRYQFPASMPPVNNIDAVADKQGRIWLMPRLENVPMAYLDIKSGKWMEFPNAAAAYVSVLDNPPEFLPPMGESAWLFNTFKPVYHGKQIAFLPAYSWVMYYDGKNWRRWASKEIVPNSTWGKLTKVYFDIEGRLVAVVNGLRWRWNGEKFEEQGKEDVEIQGVRQPGPELPGNPSIERNKVAQDNKGVFWFLSPTGLQRMLQGMTAPVFGADESSPFPDVRFLDMAYVDDCGTAFVKADHFRYFMIKPRLIPAPCRVKVELPEADVMVAKFETSDDARVRWQLDEGPWQSLEGREVRQTYLTPGRHVLRAIAMNVDLQPQKEATVVEFSVKGDEGKQLARLISGLSDASYDQREAAMAALRKQPRAQALEALRKARMGASTDLQWWIDAAVQELERKSAAVGNSEP